VFENRVVGSVYRSPGYEWQRNGENCIIKRFMIYSLLQKLLCDQIEESKTGDARKAHGEYGKHI
jgi:hypothetical protein